MFVGLAVICLVLGGVGNGPENGVAALMFEKRALRLLRWRLF